MSANKKISVLGGGSWGSALACLATRAVGNCLVHTIEQEAADEINSQHKNSRFLGDTRLPDGLKATLDIQDTIDSDIIIIAVPSFAFVKTLEDLKAVGVSDKTVFLIATKGMCENPLQLFSERIKSMFENSFGFISGPNFAQEVAQDKFASVTISSKDMDLAREIASTLSTDKLEVSITDDIITVQIAALVKNIVAIRSGMMEAEGHGENARAWLISMGLSEIKAIAGTIGGKPDSLSLPAVVGDLVLTSYSKTSRNTRFGFDFHNNSYSREYLKNYPVLVEGIASARLLKKYLSTSNLELPIISSVADRV
ncbi:MAG: NAD(P)H-dependent glycerol-3-phosphate dehydrogenase [Pseudomonadota bacterium]